MILGSIYGSTRATGDYRKEIRVWSINWLCPAFYIKSTWNILRCPHVQRFLHLLSNHLPKFQEVIHFPNF
jgi:hypothetical protein